MGSFDYLSAFYDTRHSADTIIRELDSLLSAQDLNVRAIPFGCELGSVDWLDERIAKDRHVILLWKSGRLSAFRLSYKFKENEHEQQNTGQFFVIQHEQYSNVFIALSIEPSDFYRRALLPLIHSLYPRVMMTFITHKKLRRLLESFKSRGNFTDLVITRASQRLRFQESKQARHIMPVVSWPEMTLSQAFDWVHEQNGWFESLTFEAKREHRVLGDISFTRQGVIRTDAMMGRVFESFLTPVCKTIHENIQLFSHRARLERSDLSTRPLIIDFEENQFEDVEENKRFIQAMRQLRTASISVLHGNPYVQLSILDYFDGSAFDLWILDQRQIVIVPQLKGSVPAIKRLINHIFDNYAEGHLVNYREGAR